MPMNNPYRIIVADGHHLMRAALKKIIQAVSDLEIVGEARNWCELLGLLNQVKPHMILLDFTMRKLGGIFAVTRIKRNYPNVKVLILSMHKEKIYYQHALAAGVDGYLSKEEIDTELSPAIGEILGGRIYIPRDVPYN